MIEIQNVERVNKGSLLAKCDVLIVPWNQILCDVKIFEKGPQRWIKMPCKEYTDSMGEKKYKELVRFKTPEISNKFRDAVVEAINNYLENNPEIEPAALFKEDDNIPF